MEDTFPRRIKVSKEVGHRILSILERPPTKPSKKLLEMAEQFKKVVRVDD